MVCPFELNVDESQMLAQAMRLASHPVPWLSMDGTTSGPVNSWFLLCAHWLTRLPLDYHLAHGAAALTLVAILLLCHRTAAKLFDPAAAIAGTVAVAAWLSVNQQPDFLQFASELPSLVLLFAGLAAGVGRDGRAATQWGSLAFAGLCLGLIPWAKLQAAPIAAFAGLWLWIDALRGSPVRRIARAATLAAAAILPSAIMLAWLARTGALEQFQRSYLETGLLYSGSKSFAQSARDLLELFTGRYVSPLALAGVALLAFAIWRAPSAEFRSTLRRRAPALALIGFLVVAAIGACVKPQTQFPHYQFFLVFPTGLLIAAALDLAGAAKLGPIALQSRFGFGAVLVALALGPLLAQAPGFDTVRSTLGILRLDPLTIIQARRAAVVRAAAPDARSLAVWGWEPGLYVSLQLPPSTRHAINHFLLLPGPHRQYLRETFLTDLLIERPEVVVSVTGGFSLMNADDDGRFLELERLLTTNYVLAARERMSDDSVVSVHRRQPAPR
ncbi:MAG: hypothetical protein C0518_01680 [Opitutus sp.]|nr:hypothetical protein [Opitutus sp.]